MPELSMEMKVALDAVQKAEAVVMKYFGRNPTVRIKPDHSPVSQADIESEAVIIQTIQASFPDHLVLGEESGMSAGASEFMWVIDPVDGTKNYIRGIPLFGIEVALTRNGVPIVGVSSVPALGERLFAEKGKGAFCNSLSQPIRTSDVEQIEKAHVNFGGLNYFLSRQEDQNLLRIVRAAGRLRATGDAYAFHLLATGRCEAVLDATLNFWDIAALSVIVSEAGGKCTDLNGESINVNTKSAFFSNGAIHDQLLALYWDK